ncbi:hypothetical protein AJ79_08690 [Helicocarpus griseus UAMH5409]|uniref:Uncharacterized protein n=1 Tax=Helicocarpus griseus UAMH5409 TaxID=1447875 RepID=A0A2B7WRB3_9EURO|nr:hypothetical protein AJ79_08690 [Helicocarpus griseus UAMH5409]
MASFMRWRLNNLSRESSLVFPIMVISILNLLKLRILQGHFDGPLHIRRSKLYDFAVDDHEDVMKLVIRWLRSIPHGDTTLSAEIPFFKHEVVCNEEGR